MSGYTSRVAHGAASEMLACAYLLELGYHVFRAVAATCPVDLIACRDGVTLQVEVKSMGLPGAFAWPRNDDWDLLLVVDGERVHEVEFGTERQDAVDAIRAHYGVTPVPRVARRSKGIDLSVAYLPDGPLSKRQLAFGSVLIKKGTHGDE